MIQAGFEEKSNWTNPAITYVFSDLIEEYDMHDAGLSICKYYGLLSGDKIEKLTHMSKEQKVVVLGKMQKKSDFRDALSKGFSDIRKEFYEANHLEEEDIIAVKKDAIFTRKDCEVRIFGDPHAPNLKTVEFVVKHQYSSYVKIPGTNLELYYNGAIDVKGIDDSSIPLHENGILEILKMYFRKAETGTVDDVLSYMNRVVSTYKLRKYPLEYYREFNSDSLYTDKDGEKYKEYWEDEISDLDISYNFLKILVPLTKIVA